MRIRTLIYYITTGFVTGVVMLLLAQYITSSNVRELISGNESLLQEYRLSNELVRIQKDLLLLDNKIKAAVTTRDTGKVQEFEAAIDKIRQDNQLIDKVSDSLISEAYISELHVLIGTKIDFSRQLVDSFYTAPKPAVDNAVSDYKAIRLTEDITRLTHKIDTSGRIALAEKVKSVDKSGQRVLRWNLYIIVLVLILLIAVFLIIINRMKKQAELIGQLNTSERKLKEAALIKENFLANMSHEIRTPLNAILGYTNLLQRKKLDDDSALHVATVHKSSETLLSIVNDILDLSKIESGMMRIEQAPFSLSGLIHSVTMMFHQKIEEKGLMIHTHPGTDLPDTLIGDATRLTQILVNLIGNAVKFTMKGTIELSVRIKNTSQDNIELEFKVKDSGIGIEEEKLDTIFERFRQAEDSTTRKFGGTGLGLSIVRDLVHLQNGSIDVRSKVGAGTEITFSIPYKAYKGAPIVDQFKPVPHSENMPGDLHILVVEDNVINQGLMVRLLEDRGINVKVAENGKQALEALQSQDFDLIFMDIQMPEMDGYTASREIRQSFGLGTPIVAMTAHAMAGEREKCISFGMNDHISKPIRELELIRILSDFSKHKNLKITDNEPVISEKFDFHIIDLTYMKEISGGDAEYEKMVTEQFLDLIPAALNALQSTFTSNNLPELKRIAHSMKTSISIMGLANLLDEDLDDLENAQQNENEIQQKVDHVTAICHEALTEAKTFYNQFKSRQ
ncbi:MAG TPA: response regulator [Dyadobacter sp.]|nr:response regulator [Dyadobacter sp.]